MPYSLKPPHEVQIQAKDSVKTTLAKFDPTSERYLKFIKSYAQGIGMNLSESVVLRWCLLQGYLTLMEQAVRAHDDAKDAKERIEKLMKFQELNREKFLEASCR
jgi:hypothetical protein